MPMHHEHKKYFESLTSAWYEFNVSHLENVKRVLIEKEILSEKDIENKLRFSREYF